MSGHTPESIIRCAALEIGPGSVDPDFISLSRLMRAAPDLLEALELVSAELQKYENTHHPEGSDGARDFLVKLMHAKHAIAKARGEA